MMLFLNNWTATSENLLWGKCAQRRFRSACAFAQPDQNLPCVHLGLKRMQTFFMLTTKTLIRLRGCAGWSESSLGAYVRRYVFGHYGSVWYGSSFLSNNIKWNWQTFGLLVCVGEGGRVNLSNYLPPFWKEVWSKIIEIIGGVNVVFFFRRRLVWRETNRQ